MARAVTTVLEKTVDLGYATYRTDVSLDEGVTSFLGIRYAAPPTGDLRFSAPQSPAKVSGVQNATVQPDQCFQGGSGVSSTSPFRKRTADVSSEDCLFINVHVPVDSAPDSNLPVLVWFHGGGYQYGSNGDGSPVQALVHNSNGSFICVQMQYRLGPFGFLPGQAVAADGALNAGLLDQQFALQWVQTHISKFGGDPMKVTIYGESAGAGSVLQHLVAHGGDTQPSLFRAAMMSSPFLPFQYAFDDLIPEEIFSTLSSLTGCNATLDCLRSVNADDLNAAGNMIELSNFFGVFTFVPVVDGTFIVEQPTATLSKNQSNSNVLLVVTNSHEGDIFTNATELAAGNTTLAEYITQLFPRMNDSSVQQAVALYTAIGLDDVPAQAAEVMGESIFVCPAFYALNGFRGLAWKGQFSIPPALHVDDLRYIFADATIGFPSFNNSDFIRALQDAFWSTTTNLNVNDHLSPVITPEWLPYHEDYQIMLFNKTEAGQPNVTLIAPDPGQLDRCSFWLSLAAVNGQ